MKVFDVIASAVLVLVALRTVLGAFGLAPVSWSTARRGPTAVAVACGVAALAGGAIGVADAAVLVGVVELHGRGWGAVAGRLPVRAPAVVPLAVGTLVAVGATFQSRMVGGLDTTGLAAFSAASGLALLLAVWPSVVRGLLDRGPALLFGGLAAYCGAAVVAGGRLAAVPIPGGEVQVGDLARLMVLVGTALVAVDQPWRAAAVCDRGGRGPTGAPRLSTLGPLAVAWGVALALAVLTRDFGGAALLFVELVVVIVATTGRLWPLVLGVPAGLAAFVVADRLTGHVRGRVQVWLRPEDLPAGHQHVVASSNWLDGGWLGLGWGGGRPTAIPAGRSDYVLAALGEELGLVGLAALAALVASVVIVAVRVATTSDARTGGVALAVGCFVGFQAAAVGLGVTGGLPLTGIPFPWLSSGGAAMAVNTLAAGLLVVVAASARAGAPGSEMSVAPTPSIRVGS